jgi:hypothetical protein
MKFKTAKKNGQESKISQTWTNLNVFALHDCVAQRLEQYFVSDREKIGE